VAQSAATLLGITVLLNRRPAVKVLVRANHRQSRAAFKAAGLLDRLDLYIIRLSGSHFQILAFDVLP
jgi:hypothetical protein